jgi:hypothetical protein
MGLSHLTSCFYRNNCKAPWKVLCVIIVSDSDERSELEEKLEYHIVSGLIVFVEC